MSAPLVMLHLGLGFFHRAHQAVYVHRLRESGDQAWVLAGGNTRPDMVELIASLAAQGGAYTLETVTRLIGIFLVIKCSAGTAKNTITVRITA